MKNSLLVTGGAGFIGSNFILQCIATATASIVNFDKLTYAGNPLNLESLAGDTRYSFVRGDVNDLRLLRETLDAYQPRAIVHFAAESHVDRSILGPEEFVRTNIDGTFHLLEAARDYCRTLGQTQKEDFRFLHVSTDEVYGSLKPADPPFKETNAYSPNSPYAASKAAADHLVRAYHHTYGLPTLVTNCSNNYGPLQFPEKLIPLVILNALRGLPLPVYGDGQNVRDWLYVTDHCDAIRTVIQRGRTGETYNIGGWSEKRNLEVVETVCKILDEMSPKSPVTPHARLISFVKDRPGHDRRYAIDASKIRSELGWSPKESFETGIRKTIEWYMTNTSWVDGVTSGAYQEWIKKQYAGA